jgi:TPR repeat protein
MRFLVIVAAVASMHCYGKSAPPPANPAPVRAARAPIDEARAFELGAGVTRDYAEAAAVYDKRCAAGKGDLAACRQLVRAILESRGADHDIPRAFELAKSMCDRDDALGCLMVAMSQRDPPPQHVIDVIEKLGKTPCDRDHLDRCELPLEPFGGFNQSGSHESRERSYNAEGCALGVLEACTRLQYSEGSEHDAAFVKLGVACAGGDAAACQVIGKPIDAAKLCAAHDYGLCQQLGCAGDENAATIAAAHHVEVDCHLDPARFGVKTPFATGITPSAHQTFDSVEFRQLGQGARFEIYNVGTHAISTMIGEVYAYDDAGQQVDRSHYEFRDVLEPGAGTTLDARGNDGATFEPCIGVIEFADDRYHPRIARCPAHKAKGARWGDGRDNVELRVDLSGIPLADDWVGKLEPALAEPFEQGHIGIRVSAINSEDVALFLAPTWFANDEVAELAKHGLTIEVPLVREPTTIAYRVDGAGDLQLSAPTLAKIFQHQIMKWNDAAIARDNPKLSLPATPIVVIQDSGGADERRVTAYLADGARGIWKLGASNNVEFFKDVKRVRSYDIAKAVADTDGAIAYFGPGVAEGAGLRVARLKNARGAFVAPNARTITDGSYPLAASRSLYVSSTLPDAATKAAALLYATWLLTDGQAIFERLGYGHQPDAIARAARAKLDKL